MLSSSKNVRFDNQGIEQFVTY